MRIQLLLLTLSTLILGYTSRVNAQLTFSWNDQFSHTTSTNFSNEGRKIVVDAVGNSFVLADATSNIDEIGNPTALTYYYAVILKYDPAGNRIQQVNVNVHDHAVNGFSSKSGFGLALDGLGNVYVGFNYTDPTNGSDIWIAKLDNDLIFEWAQKYFSPAEDFGESMSVDANGIVYVVGKSVTSNIPTYKILKSENTTLVLGQILAFDPGVEFINSFILDSQSNIYVTGYKLITGFKNILTGYISNTGSLIWKVVTNGGSTSRDDVGKNLALSNDNHLYVIGSSDRGGPLGNPNYDVVVVKHYAPSGKRKWEKYYDYSINDEGLFIQEFNQDYIIFASNSVNTVLVYRILSATGVSSGRFANIPRPVNPYLSNNSASISDFKLSQNQYGYLTGTITATDLGGNDFNAAYLYKFSITAGSRGGISVIENAAEDGDFMSSYNAVGIGLKYFNNTVVWLRDNFFDYSTHFQEVVNITNLNSSYSAKNNSSIISSINNNNSGVQIFPSISSGEVNVLSVKDIVSVQLFNSAGQLILSKNIQNEESPKLDISMIEDGLYIIKVKLSDNQTTFHKVIKN